jgi:uracil-DNA glycosylase
VPKITRMTYKKHKAKWKDCTKCELHKNRKHVVFARGSRIPCDIVFIGEAPGHSENIKGLPFHGHAGHLLNDMIQQAYDSVPGSEVTYAITNVIGCIPLIEEEGSITKLHDPPEECVDACAPKLKEFIRLCKPRAIVLVGNVAAKYVQCEAQFSTSGGKPVEWNTAPAGHLLFRDIVHPARIIRSDTSQQGLMVQRAIITIADLIQDLQSPF